MGARSLSGKSFLFLAALLAATAAQAAGEAEAAAGERAPGAGSVRGKLSEVEFLEKLLEDVTDPERRKQVAERLRQAREGAGYPGQVAAYNEAVALANARDYQRAIGILERMLPRIRDEELLKSTRDLLGRLREDARKFQKPPE